MHLSWHIIEFSLEVGDLTHSTELSVFTRRHNLVNVEGNDRPVTHQRVLIVIISQVLMKIGLCYLGRGLGDLVPELVVV